MDRRLEGKVAVITGTGRGIARTAALRFAAEGAKVVGCDIDEEAAAETLKLVREAGGEMECLYPLDLNDEAETHRLMAFAAETYGGIDILWNNAMRSAAALPLEQPREDWDFTLANTLTIGWLASKHAIPHMKVRGGGSIIFSASISGTSFGSGFAGNAPHLFAYAVAKAGVIRMATVLANEFGQHGIRVNTIAPGTIQTAAAPYGDDGSEFQRVVAIQHNLLGRTGYPDDVVNAALFLASDESSFITGQLMHVDGGYFASGGQGVPDPHSREVLDTRFTAFLSSDLDRWKHPGQ